MELFAVGSLLFWSVSGIWVILMFWALDRNSGLGTSILIVACILLLQFVFKSDLFKYVTENPLLSIFYVIGYLLIGIVWSFVKWWLFIHKKIEEYIKINSISREISDHNTMVKRTGTGDTIILEKYKTFNELPLEFKNNRVEKIKRLLPVVSESKGLISQWILYWPISAIWSLLNDFIKRFIRAIVTHLQNIYTSISDSIVKSTLK